MFKENDYIVCLNTPTTETSFPLQRQGGSAVPR